MLPLQGARIQSLFGELRFHMPHDVIKKLKKKSFNSFIILNQADQLPISHKNDFPLTPVSYIMI